MTSQKKVFNVDIEEGEIQSDDEYSCNFGPGRSLQQLKNEKQLLSNQERINRLYSSFLDDYHDTGEKESENSESWSTQASPKKVEKSNRTFQKAISGVMSPSYHQKKSTKKKKSNEKLVDSDIEELYSELLPSAKLTDRNEKVYKIVPSERAIEEQRKQSFRPLSSNKASTLERACLSKENLRRIADTLTEDREKKKTESFSESIDNGNESSMDIESPEEPDGQGGVPILFGSAEATPPLSDDEKISRSEKPAPFVNQTVNKDQNPAVQTSVQLPAFTPQGGNVQFRPQMPNFLPPPPFALWSLHNAMQTHPNQMQCQQLPLNIPTSLPSSIVPPIPPLPPKIEKIPPPPPPSNPPPPRMENGPQRSLKQVVSYSPLKLQEHLSSTGEMISQNRLQKPMANSQNRMIGGILPTPQNNPPPFKKQLPPPPSQLRTMRPPGLINSGDIDYRSIGSPLKPAPNVPRDVDMRYQWGIADANKGPQTSSQSTGKGSYLMPSIKRPTITIAPLSSHLQSCETRESIRNIGNQISVEEPPDVLRPGGQSIQPALYVIESSNSSMSGSKNDESSIENENLRLWQEAVASMAQKRRAKRHQPSSSTSSSNTRRSRIVVPQEPEKSVSPPLIVPIEDDIKVVEIENSPTSESLIPISNDEDDFDDTESFYEEPEEAVNPGQRNPNSGSTESSSDDEEIELLELRREAMKSMVEKDKEDLELEELRKEASNTLKEINTKFSDVSKSIGSLKTVSDSDDLPTKVLESKTTAQLSESKDNEKEVQVLSMGTEKENAKTEISKKIESAVGDKENNDGAEKIYAEKTQKHSNPKQSGKITSPFVNKLGASQFLSSDTRIKLPGQNTSVIDNSRIVQAKLNLETKAPFSSTTNPELKMSQDEAKSYLRSKVAVESQVTQQKKDGIAACTSKNTSNVTLTGALLKLQSFQKMSGAGSSPSFQVKNHKFQLINQNSKPTNSASDFSLAMEKQTHQTNQRVLINRRRIKRNSVSLSGRVAKPVAKAVIAKSIQFKMMKSSPALNQKRISRFATSKSNIGATRSGVKKNPFSKVNAKRVNYDCQAPKHPPLVINFGGERYESSDEECNLNEGDWYGASLSDSDIVSQTSSGVAGPSSSVLSGKHMASMLSWTPSDVSNSIIDVDLKIDSKKYGKSSLNPFARKRHVGKIALNTDPFSENKFQFVRQNSDEVVAETPVDDLVSSLSDSELSSQVVSESCGTEYQENRAVIENQDTSCMTSSAANIKTNTESSVVLDHKKKDKEIVKDTGNSESKASNEYLRNETAPDKTPPGHRNIFDIFDIDDEEETKDTKMESIKTGFETKPAISDQKQQGNVGNIESGSNEAYSTTESKTKKSEKSNQPTEKISEKEQHENSDSPSQFENVIARESDLVTEAQKPNLDSTGGEILPCAQVPKTMDEMIRSARISASLASDRNSASGVEVTPESIPESAREEESAVARRKIAEGVTVSDAKSLSSLAVVRQPSVGIVVPATSDAQVASSFSTSVIKQFKKQLLFVKTSREETELSISSTRKQLKRTQAKLVDAGQLASDLKKQLAAVHKTIDSLRQTAGDCDRKLLELEQKDKAMIAFEKQLLQKMSVAQTVESTSSTMDPTTKPEELLRIASSNKLIRSPLKLDRTSITKTKSVGGLTILTRDIPASPKVGDPKATTPVRLMARKTIAGSTGKRKKREPSSAVKTTETTQDKTGVKDSKVTKTDDSRSLDAEVNRRDVSEASNLVIRTGIPGFSGREKDDKSKPVTSVATLKKEISLAKSNTSVQDAKSSLAAELEATNQKLAMMRSAVIASGQNVPTRWKTNTPKWHSLSRVSRSIIRRGYVPRNVQPSKSDLQKNNLVISENFTQEKQSSSTVSGTSSDAKDLVNVKTPTGRRPLTRSRSSIMLTKDQNLNYGSKAASGSSLPLKSFQSNPAVLLAAMKTKLADMMTNFNNSEKYLQPKDNNLPKLSIKDVSIRKLKPNLKPEISPEIGRYKGMGVIGSFDPSKFKADEEKYDVKYIYDSPLKAFKSYRFCPNFLFAFKGNEGSVTWSHTIDPFVALCPFDLHGQCADKLCSFQHAKDYALTRMQLACDLLAYLHISPESCVFTEQSLQKQVSNKREQFDDLQKKLETIVQQIARNELANLTRSQIVKDMVSSVNRSRVSSLKAGEPIPEHHIMPGSRSWRPLNSRKRLHQVSELETVSDATQDPKKAKIDQSTDSNDVLANVRSKLEETKVQNAIEVATKIQNQIKSADPNQIGLRASHDQNDRNVRYFDGSCDRKSAKELKSLIQSESGDVTAWIELAKWTENNPQIKSHEIVQKAKLSVLARSLEVNRTSVELWEYYVTEFAKTSFNTVSSIVSLCNEALAYVDSDFILHLICELETKAKKKLEVLSKLVDKALAQQKGVLFIQRMLLLIKINLLTFRGQTPDKNHVVKVCEKLQNLIKNGSTLVHFLDPKQLSFLWLILIQLNDSSSLPSSLDVHMVEFFPQWMQKNSEFEPFEIEWATSSISDLSAILEMFEVASESVRSHCVALDLPNLEAMFHIRRNYARLLHFHKEHKRANNLLLECLRSSYTCFLPSNPEKCCEFLSIYALQTVQFAYNPNGIKPTLDSHLEKMNSIVKKPTKLIELCAECAEISQNKKWPAVTRYFVETTLKYFFNSTPEEIISHFRSLLYLSLTDSLQCMSVQPVEESQKKYLAVMLCFHLELEKRNDEVVNSYEEALESEFGQKCTESKLTLWSSYLSFMIRFMKLNKNSDASAFACDVLKDPQNAVMVLFQKAVKQCCNIVEDGMYACCESYCQSLERLAKIVLPNLALEPRIVMIELLMEKFPKNIYLMKTYDVVAKYNLRGAQIRCSMALADMKPCVELIQMAVQMNLQADDLSEALKCARLGRDAFPFVGKFWCEELVILCCASESCKDIPCVVQLASERGGLDLGDFVSPVLSKN